MNTKNRNESNQACKNVEHDVYINPAEETVDNDANVCTETRKFVADGYFLNCVCNNSVLYNKSDDKVLIKDLMNDHEYEQLEKEPQPRGSRLLHVNNLLPVKNQNCTNVNETAQRYCCGQSRRFSRHALLAAVLIVLVAMCVVLTIAFLQSQTGEIISPSHQQLISDFTNASNQSESILSSSEESKSFTNISECSSSPCQNDGSCMDKVYSYACVCKPGYSGALCQTDTNECLSSPCQNNGTCTDNVDSYVCTCKPGYSGSLCQIDINECSSSPCQNDGSCTDQVYSYACVCKPGYAGAWCQTDINECLSSPCQNNGTCTDKVDSYVCTCKPGYSGSLCQTDTYECSSNPCQNEGLCIDAVNGFVCRCKDGYSGAMCQLDTNECASSPCQNNGVCMDDINSFTCSCKLGYSGIFCQSDYNECSSNPCQNEAICNDRVNGFVCHCTSGYSGSICQSSATATVPGAKIHISQRGLNYGAQVAVDILSAKVTQLRIPDVHKSVKIAIGNVHLQVTNMRVTNFRQPSTSVSINIGRGLTWSVSNADISLSGNWNYKYSKWRIEIKDSGTFDGSFSAVSLSVSLTIGKDGSGRPTISTSACSSRISTMNVKMQGGASWLYNLFINDVTDPIRRALEPLICQAARQAIDDNASRTLSQFPVEVRFLNDWWLDYRLVQTPVFSAGHVESDHKGEFFYRSRGPESLSQADNLAGLRSSNDMVTILLSDYFLNTAGNLLFNSGVLRYSLSTKDIPQLRQLTADERSPDVELDMVVTDAPTAQITSAGILGLFLGNVTVHARFPDNSQTFLFKISLNLVVLLNVVLDDMKVKASISQLTPTIVVTETAVGPISSDTLSDIFKIGSSEFLEPFLNDLGQKGFFIPMIPYVRLVNPRLTFESHVLRVLTDVVYPA